jgi:ectoine hydroxylase-related dioxygenase (phytanoyl-CoA dioxygenase family)
MAHLPLTNLQVEQFKKDGFIIIRSLFDAEEMRILRDAALSDAALKSNAHDLKDNQGGNTKLSLWNSAGDDVYGLVARSHRVVDAMEQLLDGEVYHYHSKMSMKQPFEGGAWEWHQDYGYWYNNGCLFPDMASCFIAVDPNTVENGCLQVLKGSHLMGRIDHGRFGDQTGADPERTAEAMAVLELVYGVMEPGDALFLHCNTLHRSAQNKSPDPRWSLICCYNAARNNPYKESHHPRYEKLEKVPDSALKETGVKLSATKTYWNPIEDKTVGGGDKYNER